MQALDRQATSPILSVRGLKIYYESESAPVKAVDDVSFDIGQGEVVALVGESGSGKTTVALAIPKLLAPAARLINGSILFNDKKLLGMTNQELSGIRGGEIGVVFQEPTSYLNPLIKVGEQIAESLLLHQRCNKREATTRTKEILREVRIPDVDRVYESYPHQLSGGLAQRVGIGIAVSCRPSLLIADEPTSNLDLTVQAQILNLLKTLSRERNLAILLISHDLGVVSGMADRIIIMYAGRIAEEADVHSIFKNPRHPYTKALLSASRKAIREKGSEDLAGSLPDLTNPPPGCRFNTRCPQAYERCQKDPVETKFGLRSRVYCWLYGGENESNPSINS